MLIISDFLLSRFRFQNAKLFNQARTTVLCSPLYSIPRFKTVYLTLKLVPESFSSKSVILIDRFSSSALDRRYLLVVTNG